MYLNSTCVSAALILRCVVLSSTNSLFEERIEQTGELVFFSPLTLCDTVALTGD